MNSRTRALALILLASVVLTTALTGCSKSSSEPKPPTLPVFNTGSTFGFGVLQLKTVNSVTYEDQGANYVVVPSSPENVLLAALLQVSNEKAVTVLMNVKESSVELGDKKARQYQALDPFGKRTEVSSPPADSEPLAPFIWGKFELVRGYGVTGWVLFDVPKDAVPSFIRWDEVDTVSVQF